MPQEEGPSPQLTPEPDQEADAEQQEAVQGAALPAFQVVALPSEDSKGEQSVKSSGGGGVFPAWALLLLVPAAGALLLWRRWRQRARDGERPQPVQVAREQVFSQPLQLQPPAATGLAPPQTLAGRTLVVSERLDAQGVQTRFGCAAWLAGQVHSVQSHAALDTLAAAGAQAVAVVPADPLGLGPLLSTTSTLPNPVGRGRTHGGGEYGAAVAVAAGHADLALAVDELGSVRVPAACCGVYAFRPTSGVLPLAGASTASHSLAAPALLAQDPRVLLRAGEALRLPGGGTRSTVATYLVAEDYFAACGPRVQSLVPAVVAAVKRWAGPDQAQGLSLCEWLYHGIKGLAQFMGSEAAPGVNGSGQQAQEQQQQGDGQRHGRSVLEALAAAAEVVRQWEFAQKYGEWVEGAAGELPPEVAELQEQARQVTEAQYRSAQSVMTELATTIRSALREGYVFVLPTLPGEAPAAAAGAQWDGFGARSLQFSALAALAGMPQVVVPLPVPGQLPLSVSMVSLHKSDLTLLQAAAKLGPLLAEEAAKLVATQAGAAAEGRALRRPGAAPASAAAAAAAAAAPAAGKKKGAGRKRQQETDPEAKAAAEGYKESGNTALKAGRYEEAVRHYTAAAQLDPRNHVYFSNRALAHLKLGLYGQAEADCDAALGIKLEVKALLRRGSARVALGNAEGAAADFRQVLALEPQNRQAREELTAIERMEAQLQPGGLY